MKNMITTSIKTKTISFSLIFCLFTCSTIFTSCADSEMEQLTVSEPETLTAYDYLKSLDVLKAYDPQVGVAMNADTFLEKGMEYRIAVANFGQLAPVMLFNHQKIVKASGTLDTKKLVNVIGLARQHNMSLLGAPLISHRNQNVTFLNACLSPNVIRPEGDDGGYALKITNGALTALADAQVTYSFAKTPQVEPGIKYKLKMMVRGTAEGTVQVSTYSNGKGSRFTPNISVTKEWQEVELMTTMAAGIKGLTSILFSLGNYVGTLFVDNIELFEVDKKGYEVTDNLNTVNTNLDDAEQTAASVAIQTNTGGTIEEAGVSLLGEGYDPLAQYVEKTAEEKQKILTAEMQRYLTGVMSTCGDCVKDWIVVSEPLATDDGDPTSFFWKNYLGDNYAVTAFRQAATQTNGRLYIGGGTLDTNAKAQALANYVTKIEMLGARIDGITIEILEDLSSTTDYAQIFQTLAATGKLIKIADLYVDIAGTPVDNISEEQLKQQAAKLTTILNAYRANVPQAQRGGIIWHQVLDGDKPLGLWAKDYNRKHVYGSLATYLGEK